MSNYQQLFQSKTWYWESLLYCLNLTVEMDLKMQCNERARGEKKLVKDVAM